MLFVSSHQTSDIRLIKQRPKSRLTPKRILVVFAALSTLALFAHYDALVFGLMIVIPVAGALMRGAPVGSAFSDGRDLSGNLTVQGGIVHYADGREEWREDLAHYEGILWRERVVGGKLVHTARVRSDPTTTYQVVELLHSTRPDRTVLLYESTSESGVLARWEKAAFTYHLPALRDLGDGKISRRAPEDLGVPLRKLVQQGRVEDAFDIDAPPPRGIAWRRAGDTLTVAVRKNRWPHLIVVLPAALIAYLIPSEPLFLKLAILCMPILAIAWTFLDYRIEVSRDAVLVARTIGRLNLPGRRLPADDIEYVVAKSSFPVTSVEVSTHRNTLTMAFLAEDTADWLCRFLPAAAARAPAPDRRS